MTVVVPFFSACRKVKARIAAVGSAGGGVILPLSGAANAM